MWVILVVIAIVGISARIEIPALKKQKQKKERYLYISFLAMAVVIGLIIELNLFEIKPMAWLGTAFEPLSNLLMQAFK